VSDSSYNAFDEDIAMVQIFYKKSSVIQMGSQVTMTWIDYFSTVGEIQLFELGSIDQEK